MIKQVIVIRRDLKMRRGKECAQAGHASLAFALDNPQDLGSEDVREWVRGGQTKICVTVNSEEELRALYSQALLTGMRSFLIVDSGRTEFDGIPTATVLCIGPNLAEEVDKITGSLKLY